MKVGLTLLCAATLLAALPTQASEALAIKGGCIACHSPDKKLVGPTWRQVAAKYMGKADAPEALADRVRKGSKGVWGQIAMPPTDAKKLPDAELKALLAWVLKTPG
jgi:cytochrome c